MSSSTWFTTWFNCILLDFPVKLPVFICIRALDVIGVCLDWIHEYKWLNNLCWIPLCNACPCGIWEICKIADDFGIGQSCETIQFLEMPWTACCRTLFVTSQHSLHTWLMQWTSPILGHADSVKLLWVAPCHLTNLFGARHNMILHMEVRAAFICHRTCCLAVTFHFT